MSRPRTSLERQACYLRAKEAFAESHWDEARACLLQLAYVNLSDTQTTAGFMPSVNANALLARVYTRTQEPQKAITQWEIVRAKLPDKPESSLQLARLYRVTGEYRQAIDAYERLLELDASHPEPARQLPALRVQRIHSEAPEPDWSLQHIAIAGTSYCGSTVLAYQLGQLPGVKNIGETGWLTQCRTDNGTAAIDFDQPLTGNTPVCHHCGEHCPVITTAFRRALQQNPANWYYQIAQQLNTHTLISSDKTPIKYREFDPQLRFDLLVLFKSPLQSWYSNYRKVLNNTEGMHPQSDIKDWARKWVDVYAAYLHDFQNIGVQQFVFFDAICDNPTSIADLAAALGLSPLATASDVNHTRPNSAAVTADAQHYFGGNRLLTQAVKSDPAAACIKPLKPVLLPQKDIDYIDQNDDVQAVFEALKERFYRQFPPVDIAC